MWQQACWFRFLPVHVPSVSAGKWYELTTVGSIFNYQMFFSSVAAAWGRLPYEILASP